MSELLGALGLSGKGGNELFVYDDCLVRASTGLVATLTGGDVATLLGGPQAPGTPDELVMRHPDNRMVRRLDIRDATLAKGRWPGDSATRRLNNDAYAVTLLTAALGELLEVRLP